MNFFMPPVLLKKITAGGSMFSKTIGQVMSLDELSRDWVLVHFAPANNRAKLELLLQQQGLEQAESLVDQHNLHLSKKDTVMHIQGSFDSSLDMILSTVANFIVFTLMVTDAPEWGVGPNNPLLVNSLIDLADVLGTDPSAKQSIHDRASKAKNSHLLFSLFACFQDVLGALGKLMVE